MGEIRRFDEYAAEAMKTDIFPRVHSYDGMQELPVYPSMALCGEAGEAVEKLMGLCASAGKGAEKVKKAWRDHTHLDVVEYIKELGDCLWYITAAARSVGMTLEDVANLNIAKLRDRRARGILGGSGDNR